MLLSEYIKSQEVQYVQEVQLVTTSIHDELMDLLAQQIQAEIDREILNELYSISGHRPPSQERESIANIGSITSPSGENDYLTLFADR